MSRYLFLAGVFAASAFSPFFAGCQSVPAPGVTGGDTAPPPGPAEEAPESSAAGLRRFYYADVHMGTKFAFTCYAPDVATARAAARAAFERVAELDAALSDYDPESELMRLCQQPHGQAVAVGDDLFFLLETGLHLAHETGGAFDPTTGPLTRLWRRSRRLDRLPTEAELAMARAAVGPDRLGLDPAGRTVTLHVPGMRLDLGGIAKGYAADEALEVFRRHGLDRALVAAGGDIAAGLPPPGREGWTVALPEAIGRGLASGPSRALSAGGSPAALLLANAAVSTSGDTEQSVAIGGQRYSHIIDPATGLGLTRRRLVSVIAPTATQSDSYATALSVMEPADALAFAEGREGVEAALCLFGEPESGVGAGGVENTPAEAFVSGGFERWIAPVK